GRRSADHSHSGGQRSAADRAVRGELEQLLPDLQRRGMPTGSAENAPTPHACCSELLPSSQFCFSAQAPCTAASNADWLRGRTTSKGSNSRALLCDTRPWPGPRAIVDSE